MLGEETRKVKPAEEVERIRQREKKMAACNIRGENELKYNMIVMRMERRLRELTPAIMTQSDGLLFYTITKSSQLVVKGIKIKANGNGKELRDEEEIQENEGAFNIRMRRIRGVKATANVKRRELSGEEEI